MVITTWVLLVQLWTESPPQIQLLYHREFETYERCWQEREEWIKTKFVVTCQIKVINSE